MMIWFVRKKNELTRRSLYGFNCSSWLMPTHIMMIYVMVANSLVRMQRLMQSAWVLLVQIRFLFYIHQSQDIWNLNFRDLSENAPRHTARRAKLNLNKYLSFHYSISPADWVMFPYSFRIRWWLCVAFIFFRINLKFHAWTADTDRRTLWNVLMELTNEMKWKTATLHLPHSHHIRRRRLHLVIIIARFFSFVLFFHVSRTNRCALTTTK